MSKPVRRYHADQKLAELLKAAAEAHEPLQIVTAERTYELDVREPESTRDIWKAYDPEAALRAVRASPCETEPVDRQALAELVTEIRTERDQDSRGRPAET